MTKQHMDAYYKVVKDVNLYFGRKLSNSAKSQHLSTMRKSMESGKHSSANNIFAYISEMTDEFSEMPAYEFSQATIHSEILQWYNKKLIAYGNRPCATLGSFDECITLFNRNYMMKRPLENVNQLKLYDRRLKAYIDTNKVNNTTIWFLIFLMLYTE